MNNIKISNKPKLYVSTKQTTFFYRPKEWNETFSESGKLRSIEEITCPKLGFTNITQGREKVVLTFFAYFLVARQESKVGVGTKSQEETTKKVM